MTIVLNNPKKVTRFIRHANTYWGNERDVCATKARPTLLENVPLYKTTQHYQIEVTPGVDFVWPSPTENYITVHEVIDLLIKENKLVTEDGHVITANEVWVAQADAATYYVRRDKGGPTSIIVYVLSEATLITTRNAAERRADATKNHINFVKTILGEQLKVSLDEIGMSLTPEGRIVFAGSSGYLKFINVHMQQFFKSIKEEHGLEIKYPELNQSDINKVFNRDYGNLAEAKLDLED